MGKIGKVVVMKQLTPMNLGHTTQLEKQVARPKTTTSEVATEAVASIS